MQKKQQSSFSCLWLLGPDLNDSICWKSLQTDAAEQRRWDVGRMLDWSFLQRPSWSLAAILCWRSEDRSPSCCKEGELIQKRIIQREVILQQQCHHFLSVGSRRGRSEVECRSPQRGVKGHCRVCCTKPVKWSLIFISDRCWWIGLWHNATLQEKVCLSHIWQNQCKWDKSALCCQTPEKDYSENE